MAFIVVVGGTVIWPMLFKEIAENGVPLGMGIYLVVMLVTDIIILLVELSWYSYESFGGIFIGKLQL